MEEGHHMIVMAAEVEQVDIPKLLPILVFQLDNHYLL